MNTDKNTIKMLSEQVAVLEYLNRALKKQIEINEKRIDLICARISQLLEEGGEGNSTNNLNN